MTQKRTPQLQPFRLNVKKDAKAHNVMSGNDFVFSDNILDWQKAKKIRNLPKKSKPKGYWNGK